MKSQKTTTKFILTASIMLLTFIVFLTGCGDDNPTGSKTELTVQEGRYTLDASGDLPAVTSGTARFGIGRPFGPANEQLFMIKLTGFTASQDTFGLGFIGVPERPEPGTYSFLDYLDGDPENPEDQITSGKFLLFGALATYENEELVEAIFIVSRSGTLTILESSPERVSGTFTVKVVTGEGQSTRSGTYEGEFIATPGDFGN